MFVSSRCRSPVTRLRGHDGHDLIGRYDRNRVVQRAAAVEHRPDMLQAHVLGIRVVRSRQRYHRRKALFGEQSDQRLYLLSRGRQLNDGDTLGPA